MRNFRINEKGEVILQINLGNNLESAMDLHRDLLRSRELIEDYVPKEEIKLRGENYLDISIRNTAMDIDTIEEFYILNPREKISLEQ